MNLESNDFNDYGAKKNDDNDENSDHRKVSTMLSK